MSPHPVVQTRRARLGAALACLLLTVPGLAPSASARTTTTGCASGRWVGSWAASPGYTYQPGYAAQTLRVAVSPHLGGSRLRIRLTNRFGTQPVRIDALSVARASDASSAALIPGTTRALTFGGHVSVVLPAGQDVTSDPVSLTFPPFAHLAVSLFVPAPTGPATEHFDGHQLSWTAAGDMTKDQTGVPFVAPSFRWPFLTGVDVIAPQGVGAVVALGDSITDGYQYLQNGSYALTLNSDQRYPDLLAQRLARSSQPRLAVLNAGISGNKLLTDAAPGEDTQLGYGPAALHRLDRDVLALPGVTDVILLEGTNDIGGNNASAAAITGALRTIVRRVRASGRRIQLGTLTPRNDGISAAQQSTLEQVNQWIRSQRLADGVIDFAAAIRDPNEHGRIDPKYDSGDGLHPNSAGYQAMADAIHLDALAAASC